MAVIYLPKFILFMCYLQTTIRLVQVWQINFSDLEVWVNILNFGLNFTKLRQTTK